MNKFCCQFNKIIHMGQSLVASYHHIVFSTKGRQPIIDPTIERKLHGYLYGICKHLECTPHIVGGYVDHVHIRCEQSKKLTLIKLLENLKSSSSMWVKTQGAVYTNFYWQNGYGAFSVNPKARTLVKKYIEHQHSHHSNKTFQDEFRGFLKNYNISYDERYVWD